MRHFQLGNALRPGTGRGPLPIELMATTRHQLPRGLAAPGLPEGPAGRVGACFPQAGVVGAAFEDVSGWTMEQRLLEAARLAGPLLPPAMQGEFKAMFTGRNLALMAGVLAAWAASHAFGVGEVLDLLLFLVGLVVIGSGVLQCATDLARFVTVARQARRHAELNEAAACLARVVAVLGVTVFMALLTRVASRLPRGRAAGLRAEGAPAAGRGLPSAGGASEPARLYETLLPVDKVMEGDGIMAQAMRKAALDDWYRNYPQLNKWRRYNPKTRQWESAAQKRASHLAGSNLVAPVVRRQLEAGTEIIQYQTVGRQLGFYLAAPGAAPADLAILADGRILRRFVVLRPFEALETMAAPFPRGQVPGVGGPGGGLQLIMPPHWERFVEPIWGRRI